MTSTTPGPAERAVAAVVELRLSFEGLPMPAAHGAPRPSTLADLAALHIEALERLVDHWAAIIVPDAAAANLPPGDLARIADARMADLEDAFAGAAPRYSEQVEAMLDEHFGDDRPPSVYVDYIPIAEAWPAAPAHLHDLGAVPVTRLPDPTPSYPDELR